MNDPIDTGIDAELRRPRFIMMSGTYCAGKSTWTDAYLQRAAGRDPVVISFDGIVQEQAEKLGMSRHELMQVRTLYDNCSTLMMQRLGDALSAGKNIVLDNTNTTKTWRKEILNMVHAAQPDYHTTAVCMQITRAEGERRFHARNAAMTDIRDDQKKPVEHFHRHYSQYAAATAPSLDEFDLVVQVPTKQFCAERWAKTVGDRGGASR